MPPSGFREQHTESVRVFLRGCLHDLVDENQGVRTPRAALQREIDHIDKHGIDSDARPSPTVAATLVLVGAFYSQLLSDTPEDETDYFSFRDRGLAMLNAIVAELLAIKILDEA